jgi:hypothetical protein
MRQVAELARTADAILRIPRLDGWNHRAVQRVADRGSGFRAQRLKIALTARWKDLAHLGPHHLRLGRVLMMP